MKTKDCLRHFNLHCLCLIFIVIIIIFFPFGIILPFFFHSEHERQVKRQDEFAILEVINYQAFFSLLSCVGAF